VIGYDARAMRSEVDTGRLEAFSDGVFAIAITLLIIEVGVRDEGGSLAQRLAEQWPSYVAFVVSFAVIGIIWLNHHHMFKSIRTADHGLFVLNLLLLMAVSFIPFPTKVMGDELHGTFADQRTAALFYGATFVAVSFAFNALWLWAAHGRRLIEPGTVQPIIDAHTRRSLLSIPTYAVATLVALWSPEGALFLYGVITLFYLLPGEWLDRLLVPELRAPEPEGRRHGTDPRD
jgi:uncharacterized membrane protein